MNALPVPWTRPDHFYEFRDFRGPWMNLDLLRLLLTPHTVFNSTRLNANLQLQINWTAHNGCMHMQYLLEQLDIIYVSNHYIVYIILQPVS
jgi:hypothetical protein